jgi:hypothetical protein
VTPDGELTETGNIPGTLFADRHHHPDGADDLGGQGDGERLYKKAHRGEEVERPSREVEIHERTRQRSGFRRIRDPLQLRNLCAP